MDFFGAKSAFAVLVGDQMVKKDYVSDIDSKRVCLNLIKLAMRAVFFANLLVEVEGRNRKG